MMSIGWQRNEANDYVRLKPDYLSYKRYWDIYCQWIKKMKYAKIFIDVFSTKKRKGNYESFCNSS